MTASPQFAAVLVTIASLVAAPPAIAFATSVDEPLARPASWSPADPAAVRLRLLDSIAALGAAGGMPADAVERADAAWQAAGGAGGGVLDAVLEALAAARSNSSGGDATLDRSDRGGAADAAAAPLIADAEQLGRARDLVRQDRFDEALPILAALDVATSVDPTTLLFLRGACEHALLDADAALETLDRLLEREAELPARYARIARLLRTDAAALEKDSLDHIARRMRDAGRRLALGRAGEATRQVQQEVVDALDRLIARLEDEQRGQAPQQAAAGGAGGSRGGQGGTPMEESRIAGGRGAGETRSRELAPGESWGDLPPHERDRVIQQIGREFPPHYREAIERYFKRLATDGEEP